MFIFSSLEKEVCSQQKGQDLPMWMLKNQRFKERLDLIIERYEAKICPIMN